MRLSSRRDNFLSQIPKTVCFSQAVFVFDGAPPSASRLRPYLQNNIIKQSGTVLRYCHCEEREARRGNLPEGNTDVTGTIIHKHSPAQDHRRGNLVETKCHPHARGGSPPDTMSFRAKSRNPPRKKRYQTYTTALKHSPAQALRRGNLVETKCHLHARASPHARGGSPPQRHEKGKLWIFRHY